MAYCTHQDLIDRFGEEELIQLTDRTNTGAIDAQVLDQVIADADAEIDGYLASRPYVLPLNPVPTALVRIACEITRYHLYDDHAPENIEKRYDNAVKFLRAVSKGDVVLVRDDGAKADESAGMPEFDAGRSVFGGGGF